MDIFHFGLNNVVHVCKFIPIFGEPAVSIKPKIIERLRIAFTANVRFVFMFS